MILVGTGCGALGERTGGDESGGGAVDVVTTTNFITDTVARIGGGRVSIHGLMGPGVDPHLYKASAGDVTALRDADLIFYGGLFLEAKMEDVFLEMAESRPVIAVSEQMPRERLLKAPVGTPAGEEFDPHVWFDVTLWRFAVERIRDALVENDPEGAALYRENAKEYLAELDRLDRETARRLNSVPARQRVLVTSHDAFRYLGRRYGVDVAAIQGISTAAEATTGDIERVADVIVDRKVKSVFIESSLPPQTLEAVLAAVGKRGHQATIGGELYSDAAGEEGTPKGAYIGMVESNVNNLVEGLE